MYLLQIWCLFTITQRHRTPVENLCEVCVLVAFYGVLRPSGLCPSQYFNL